MATFSVRKFRSQLLAAAKPTPPPGTSAIIVGVEQFQSSIPAFTTQLSTIQSSINLLTQILPIQQFQIVVLPRYQLASKIFNDPDTLELGWTHTYGRDFAGLEGVAQNIAFFPILTEPDVPEGDERIATDPLWDFDTDCVFTGPGFSNSSMLESPVSPFGFRSMGESHQTLIQLALQDSRDTPFDPDFGFFSPKCFTIKRSCQLELEIDLDWDYFSQRASEGTIVSAGFLLFNSQNNLRSLIQLCQVSNPPLSGDRSSLAAQQPTKLRGIRQIIVRTEAQPAPGSFARPQSVFYTGGDPEANSIFLCNLVPYVMEQTVPTAADPFPGSDFNRVHRLDDGQERFSYSLRAIPLA